MREMEPTEPPLKKGGENRGERKIGWELFVVGRELAAVGRFCLGEPGAPGDLPKFAGLFRHWAMLGCDCGSVHAAAVGFAQ